MNDTTSVKSKTEYGQSVYSQELNNKKQFFEILKNGNKFQLSSFLKNPDIKFWNYVEEGNHTGLHVAVMKDLNPQIKLMFGVIEERFSLSNFQTDTDETKMKTMKTENNYTSLDVIRESVKGEDRKDDCKDEGDNPKKTSLNVSTEDGNFNFKQDLSSPNTNNLRDENTINYNKNSNASSNINNALETSDIRISNNIEARQIISTWINTPTNKGDTCLHYAAYKGNFQIISIFSIYEIRPEYKNKQGNTVMHNSAQGNQPLAFIFFNQKFQTNAIEGNKDGSTPLHWACYTGSDIAFNFIIGFYEDINIQDNDGLTPLHLAVISERTEIVKKLLHKGADKSIRDKKGRTPKQLAEEKGKDFIAKMLEDQVVCPMIVFRNPLQKIERSYSNVWVFCIIQSVSQFAYFTILMPCKSLFLYTSLIFLF
jgi:hypothetical protein